MLRRRTMTKAFVFAISEMRENLGDLDTISMLDAIGEKLAEIEGPALMGRETGNLYLFEEDLFSQKISEFLEEVNPSDKNAKDYLVPFENGDKYISMNVFAPLGYAYRKKRAQLAGKNDLIDLGAKGALCPKKLNEKYIKELKHSDTEISKLLDKYERVSVYL